MATNVIKAAVIKALDRIGYHNGHSCPVDETNHIGFLHEYYVATLGESYFKKRREVAKKNLESILNDEATDTLDRAVKRVTKSEIGESVTIEETAVYILSVDLKNGASYLDVPALRVMLMREHKMDATEVEALIEKCTKRRDPSKGWKVQER